LDAASSEFSIIAEKTTLDDMKEFIIKEIPGAIREVTAWGHEGCKLFDLIEYGAVADGITDDTDIILRVLDLVKTGDVITLPADRRIKVKPGIMIPISVVTDIRDEQFVVDSVKKAGIVGA
jgi:hypothetical protein